VCLRRFHLQNAHVTPCGGISNLLTPPPWWDGIFFSARQKTLVSERFLSLTLQSLGASLSELEVNESVCVCAAFISKMLTLRRVAGFLTCLHRPPGGMGFSLPAKKPLAAFPPLLGFAQRTEIAALAMSANTVE